MSSTNKTNNIGLTQFIATDKPSWLSDYNNDMLAIDKALVPESGTNENGSYIKFHDGTLICMKTFTGTTGEIFEWGYSISSKSINVGSWAVPFKSQTQPHISYSVVEGFYENNVRAYFNVLSGRKPTHTLCGTIYLTTPDKSYIGKTANAEISVIGYGRWK